MTLNLTHWAFNSVTKPALIQLYRSFRWNLWSIFTQAIVQPLLDTSVLSNFRPIFKLPLISKILENAVTFQLQSSLDTHRIPQVLQLGLTAIQSMETTLLRAFNDHLLTADTDGGSWHSGPQHLYLLPRALCGHQRYSLRVVWFISVR